MRDTYGMLFHRSYLEARKYGYRKETCGTIRVVYIIGALKIFQNGRPDTSACEDITPRNLCIQCTEHFAYLTSKSLNQAQMRIKRLAN